MPSERAAKLAAVIASRHKREAEGLCAALGVPLETADTIALVSVFTIGRIVGMMQTMDVIQETGD